MAAMVSDWQASGMSQREYAELHNMSGRRFGYWISKHREQDQGSSCSSFVQLVDDIASGIRIRYPHGVEVILPGSTPVGYLRALIQS